MGEEPLDFWEANSEGTRLTILESALASVEGSRRDNEPLLVFKAFWFRWGYWALAAGLVALLATTLWHNYR
jgi:hypothetical protein